MINDEEREMNPKITETTMWFSFSGFLAKELELEMVAYAIYVTVCFFAVAEL
jgi:hypothetical protein